MSPTITHLLDKKLSFSPYAVKWIPCSARLCTVGATSQGTGRLSVYSLVNKQLELQQEVGTNSALRCGTITGQSRQFATGDFDGQVQIWDTQQVDIPLISFKAHESIINAIDSYNRTGEPQELVTGSRDVKVWDIRQTDQPILTITSNAADKDVWAVKYGQMNGHKVIVVGYEDGDLKLFSVKDAKYIWETKVKDGICSIDMDKQTIYVSTISGAFTIDIMTGVKKEIRGLPSDDTTFWSIECMQPNYFSIAGGNGNLLLYNTENMESPVHELNLSKHPLISLDWNHDKKGLYACTSFDLSIKIGMVY
ncbi:WD40-repeat-containing domain protein [Pilobolus umbonatus]|nr:WD40-repeat-containing domain protein [Pilobolus umbonatus]